MSNQITLPQKSTTSVAVIETTRESVASFIKKLHVFFNTFASDQVGGGKKTAQVLTKLKRNLNFKKNKFFFIPLAIIVILLIVGVTTMIRTGTTSPKEAIAGATDSRVALKPALATQTINKTFSFPLQDADGKEVSKIKYTIEKADLQSEIIVKGQKATSVKGRAFLIISLKIQNDYNAPVQINARDYVRLIVNGKTDEKLAPDIHNDPVEVQAISTKQTRLGFPVDTDTEKLVLQVGEINGDKQDITLDLK